MSASKDQSTLNQARGTGTTFGPNDGNDSSTATPAMSAGSATAMGHGQHPKDDADDGNVTLPASKIGPQLEELDGEKEHTVGEGEVMNAQFNKKNAGWGEQDSITSNLDRQKAEQRGLRDQLRERREGTNINDSAGNRLESEGLSQV